MSVTGAIEILLLRAATRQRALPELAQVGIDIAVAVGGPGERAAAAGAVTGGGLFRANCLLTSRIRQIPPI
jgi:hypothetical protein